MRSKRYSELNIPKPRRAQGLHTKIHKVKKQKAIDLEAQKQIEYALADDEFFLEE